MSSFHWNYFLPEEKLRKTKFQSSFLYWPGGRNVRITNKTKTTSVTRHSQGKREKVFLCYLGKTNSRVSICKCELFESTNMLIPQQTHTFSYEKSPFLNSVIGLSTWFILADTRTVFHTGRGGWKHVFYVLKRFQIELLFQTEGLCYVCLVRRNERKERKKARRPSVNTTPNRERERNRLHMFNTISHRVKFQSVFVFLSSRPLDYNLRRRHVSSYPTHTNACHVNDTHTQTL